MLWRTNSLLFVVYFNKPQPGFLLVFSVQQFAAFGRKIDRSTFPFHELENQPLSEFRPDERLFKSVITQLGFIYVYPLGFQVCNVFLEVFNGYPHVLRPDPFAFNMFGNKTAFIGSLNIADNMLSQRYAGTDIFI